MAKVCYLCGEKGANTKDHVPPKCLLPKNQSSHIQRLTLAAHKQCNNQYSRDEEYFRDLIGPTAIDYSDGDAIYFSTQRAWQTSHGRRRLNMFLRNAQRVQLYSKAGLYLGKAIGVQPDLHRIVRVGMKIAQGVIFTDTGNFADPRVFQCVPIQSKDVPDERNKELNKNNPYWSILSSDYCRHTNFSPSVAVRRAYTPVSTEPILTCLCFMMVMIYSQSFVVFGEIGMKKVPKDFTMIGFNDGYSAEDSTENS